VRAGSRLSLLDISRVQDGPNEIAVMYGERFGDGGLGHLELEVVASE